MSHRHFLPPFPQLNFFTTLLFLALSLSSFIFFGGSLPPNLSLPSTRQVDLAYRDTSLPSPAASHLPISNSAQTLEKKSLHRVCSSDRLHTKS